VRASGIHNVTYQEGASNHGSLSGSYGVPKIVDNTNYDANTAARSSGNFYTTRLADSTMAGNTRAGNVTMSATGRPGYNEHGEFM